MYLLRRGIKPVIVERDAFPRAGDRSPELSVETRCYFLWPGWKKRVLGSPCPVRYAVNPCWCFEQAVSLERIDLSQLSSGAGWPISGPEACSLKSPGWSGVVVCNMRRILINSRKALLITATLLPVGLPCRRGKWLTGTCLTVMPNLDA